MATEQKQRILNITTPLGKDFLLAETLKVSEGISRLFSIEVTLLHEETPGSTENTPVNAKSILGQQVNIQVALEEGLTKRYFSGMVNRIAQGSREQRFSKYYATVVPHVWLLTQRQRSRIFQHKSVPDILREVFEGFDVKYEIQGTFHPRNYCVQYRESDWDFVSRLMEEEGIFYFFLHTENNHRMVVANTPASHPKCSKAQVPYFHKVEGEAFEVALWSFEAENAYQTGKVTFWDHHFQLPGKSLEAQKQSIHTIAENKKLEFYDFPGEYAKRYDGIDKGGGEQASELSKIFEDNARKAGIVNQVLDARYKIAFGTGTCCNFVVGHKFEVVNHPGKDGDGASLNAEYVLTSIQHTVQQSPSYISENLVANPYTNTFECIPVSAPFRPQPLTPKPVVRGCQTATVVGPAGQEIFTDKYGRVKVQFHWDREGKQDINSSCWLRVAQMWAGNQWGTMFIPRIKMEVIVDFIEGDPDQPIIVGCVYNPANMPPYKLPDEKTKSTLKSNSSKGGGGFNEFRFEDNKGKEQIFIHAERNEDIRVKSDCFETIGNERHLYIGKDQLEWVKGDQHLKVKGEKREKIDQSVSTDIGMNRDEKVAIKHALEAGQEIHLKAGMNVTIEAGMMLTLKVGGSFISLSPAGVTIVGSPLTMINSGGASGSGSGSRPQAPKEAKEADTAEAGKPSTMPGPPPPTPKDNLSPLPNAMARAADSGAPMVSDSGSPPPPPPPPTIQAPPPAEAQKQADPPVNYIEPPSDEKV
jgi:type VI secretion system secreted protein VgrG